MWEAKQARQAKTNICQKHTTGLIFWCQKVKRTKFNFLQQNAVNLLTAWLTGLSMRKCRNRTIRINNRGCGCTPCFASVHQLIPWRRTGNSPTAPHRRHRIPPPGLFALPCLACLVVCPCEAFSASTSGFYSCRVFILPRLCSPFSCLQHMDKRNGKPLTFMRKMPRSTYSIQLLCLRCCLSWFECTPHVDMVRQIEQIVFWYSAYIKIHISPSPLHQAGNAIRYFISIWLYLYLYSIFCIDMVVSILNELFIEQFSLQLVD